MMPKMSPHPACHTLSGVMVSIQGRGVLIRGDSGMGKSSLGLALINEGHQLVADDVIEVTSEGDTLYAHCPNMLIGLLHTRELGTIDISTLFGATAVLESSSIQYVVDLSNEPFSAELEGQQRAVDILGITLPSVQLSTINPAPLTMRLHTWLKMQQHQDANEILKRRQQAQMQQ
jgi:HPr kinase/phosphorylase